MDMDILTRFADVKPGMFFPSDKWTKGRSGFVLKKSAEKISMLMIQRSQSEIWNSSNEWNPLEWKDTWMSIERPIKPDYQLIVKSLWDMK